ncbi:MAG: hypothetical protein R3D55_23615 [Chloroflexota bacterium]
MRKNESPVWLSEIVSQNFQENYPLLASIKIHNDWREKTRQNFPLSLRLALIVFFSLTLLNEFFVWQGWIISTYSLDSQQAADILASSLEYLAGLVGIVLPIIFIIVEFVSKDKGASSLVDVYLDKTDLKTTAIWALIFLAIEAAIMAIFRANILIFVHPKFVFFSILLFTLLNLGIIFETGKTIWNLRNSLSNRFLIETLSSKLATEIRKSQKIEVVYRLSRRANLNIYEQLGLERSQYGQQLQNMIPILSTRTGVLKDIHLLQLQEFSQLIETTSERAFLAKLVNDSVQKDDVIAYVPSSLSIQTEEIHQMIENCFILREEQDETNTTNDEVKTLLNQVKQAAESSIREENSLFFDELMSVYHQIFEMGVGLPIPASTEWFSDFIFRGWFANRIAIIHLRDFVEVSARSKNREFIDNLSYDIRKIAISMIQNSNVLIDDNLSEVLGLYAGMYYFSHKYKNDLGINRSYFYLTRNIIDQIWDNYVHALSKEENLQAIKNLTLILNHVLETLSKILHQTFLNQDEATLTSLLNIIQPKELLASFHPPPTIHYQYYILQQRLEEASVAESRILNEQFEALSLVRNIPEHVDHFFNQVVFLAISYLCESYERDEITIAQFVKTYSIFERYLLSAQQTILMFSKLIENQSAFGWHLFTRHPDTRRGYFPNDEDKLFLFYCLRGMILVDQNEAQVATSVNLRHQLSRIEETCNRIVTASSDWLQTNLFVGIETDLSTLAQTWIELNHEVNERWQAEYKDQIINASLDITKTQAFANAVQQSIIEGSRNSLMMLLESMSTVIRSDETEKKIIVWHYVEKEDFTELYIDSSTSTSLGEQYGNGIVQSINSSLIHVWLSNSKYLPTRKDWKTLKPYFDRAINPLSEMGSAPSFILVPFARQLHTWLSATPGFLHDYQVPDAETIPMLRGFYNGIPVLEYYPEDGESLYILCIDLNNACQVKIDDPITEIRELTDQEIDRALSNNPEKTRRDYLLNVSVKAIYPFDIEILDRDAILRLKIKLT